MGKIIKNSIPYGGTSTSAGNISYNNTSSGLISATVQNAITELKSLFDNSEHIRMIVVDELPSVVSAEDNVVYLIDEDSSGVYEEYIVAEVEGVRQFIKIGETDIDLSSYLQQVTTLPTPSAANVGKIYQYIGETTANYIHGYTYECVSDGANPATYSWVSSVDTTPTQNSTNTVISDGIYRNTAGKKYFVNNVLRGETFNGTTNVASGYASHAEGYQATASGDYSHAEGGGTTASGSNSHAEGASSTASGDISHAEGLHTTATGDYSHAEGSGTIASESNSHAEGYTTTASGYASHAEGGNTAASGTYSHAGGYYTIANKANSTAIGRYNVADTNVEHLLIVGNGTGNARSNILEVSYTDMNVNGDIQQNGVPIRATAMPTITASMLGKVVQYVGETTNDYVKGYFYIASSDGAAEPAYSWENINVSSEPERITAEELSAMWEV